jgi:hypothetical protein
VFVFGAKKRSKRQVVENVSVFGQKEGAEIGIMTCSGEPATINPLEVTRTE